MATQRNLPDDLDLQMQELAREQNREPDDVLADAVRQYLRDQKWQRLVHKGELRARENGYTEEDVPRLIEEVRVENRTRGR